MGHTVTYWSVSMFTRKTFWINALAIIAEILTLTDTLQIIPENRHAQFALVMGAVNIILRRFTVRPATFMAPGDSKPVQVEKLAVGSGDRTPPGINGIKEIHD